MGLPTTISGIAGFVIFVIIILGMTAPDLYPDQSAKIQESQNIFYANINSTLNSSTSQNLGFWSSTFGLLGLDGVYTFITNFFSMLVSFIVMNVQYVLLFFGIAASLPTEFYILFAIVGMSAIVAVLKLVFMSGD